MGAFDQPDTSAKSASDTANGALYSEAYSNKSPDAGRKMFPLGRDTSNLPPVSLDYQNAIDPDLNRSIQSAQHKEDLDKYDKNHDGKLDDKELDAAIKSSSDLSEIMRLEDKKKYDKNRDGVIEGDEDQKRMEDRMRAYFDTLKKYDANHNGKIDEEEQRKMIDEALSKTNLFNLRAADLK